jgi:hypothetical protein
MLAVVGAAFTTPVTLSGSMSDHILCDKRPVSPLVGQFTITHFFTSRTERVSKLHTNSQTEATNRKKAVDVSIDEDVMNALMISGRVSM